MSVGRRRELVGEPGNGMAEGVDRIGVPGIAPTVAAGAGEQDLEAAAGQRPVGDALERRAVEHEPGADARRERRLAGQVPHAAEVAFALLADVGDQHQARRGVLDGRGGT